MFRMEQLFLFGEANTFEVEISLLMSHVQKTRETEASLVFLTLTMHVSYFTVLRSMYHFIMSLISGMAAEPLRNAV